MRAGAQLPECQQTHTSSPPYSGAPAGQGIWLEFMKETAGQGMQQDATRAAVDNTHGIVASARKIQVMHVKKHLERSVGWTLTEIRQRHILGWKLVFGKLDSQAPLLDDKPAQRILNPAEATEQKQVEVVSHASWPLGSEALMNSVSQLVRTAVAAARCMLQRANRKSAAGILNLCTHASFMLRSLQRSSQAVSALTQEWQPGSGKVQTLLPACMASC